MMLSGNRILFLCLALFLWRNANGLGVWKNGPNGGAFKRFGDAALYPAQQDFSSGVQTAVGDVGSAQPLSTSGSGDSVASVPGFLRQYTVSRDQNVLSPFSSFPQSQAGYTALSSVSSGGLSLSPQITTNQAALGFQNQLLSSPGSNSQSSASQSLSSQQSSLKLASPGQATSSLPQSFKASYVFGTGTQPSSPGTVSLSVASDYPTTSKQASSGSQSATGKLYGQPSSWYSFTAGQTPSQSVTASFKPVSLPQGSASQSSASKQSSLQLVSPSLGSSSLPQSLSSSYVFGTGTQTQPSSPGTVSLSVASDFPATSQQASSVSQSAVGTLYGQPSSWYSYTLGQTPSPSVTASYKPVSLPQGSASQSSASQQSSVKFEPSSLGSSSLPQSLSARYILGTQTQPSRPATVSLSVASDLPTTSQQATGSQSAAGTLYGLPSSWFSSTQGQSFQTASQFGASPDRPASSSQGSGSLSSSTLQTPSLFQATPYQPAAPSQGSAGQPLASQQSSLQVTSSSQGLSPQPLTLSCSYDIGTQTQPSRPVTVPLSVASDFPTTSQQASSGFLSAAGTLYGQSSAGQSLASQQSSLQVTSPSQGLSPQPLTLSCSYDIGTQTQPSRPVTVPLSVASDFPTTSQQASSGFLSAAGTLYGQPSSWYSFTQGQTPPQSVTTSYKPVSKFQGSASQSPASQQSSLQLGLPSLGTAFVPAVQVQSSSPVTSTLSLASNLPATSQASYGSQSATSTLYGQSADTPNTLGVAVIDAYTAGPAQWGRVDPFGQTSQTNVPLSQFQVSGSQGSQAASSSFPSTSQSQSTTGSIGFGFQSQSDPASTVSLTQSAAQLPSFQAPSGFPSTSFSAASPSASVSQSFPSSVLAWSSPSLSTSQTQSSSGSSGFGFQSAPASTYASTSFGQSSSGQVAPVATTQKYSSGLQGIGPSGTFPSQSASTSQTSGSYGSTFQSSATQVGSFDQFSPLSSPLTVASKFTQGSPNDFGLRQGYSSQPIDFRPATGRVYDFSVKE